MTRLSFAFAIAFVAGCGSPKGIGSICDDPNAPTTCGQTCDATPGAANTCGDGLYCSEDGACNAQCSADHACPDNYSCTPDGRCIDNGGGDDQPPIDSSCPAVNFTPMPTTPSIGLVLDQSGSMYDYHVDMSGTTNGCMDANCRYRVMREALVGTTGVVTELETKAYFGASIYSCDDNNQYVNPGVDRALSNAAGVRTLIDSKLMDRGGNTPTPKAIDDMVAKFGAMPPPTGSPPVIVLATDGLPNSCNSQNGTETQSVNAAKAAFTAGIPVYVLAIGTSSQHFQDLANAGQGHVTGQPDIPFYPVSNAQQMKDAFQTIINGVISCDLTLTSTIDDTQAGQGTVTVNGMNLIFGTDWMLVNGNTIRLVGQACTNLKATPNPTVNASFPCGAVIF